MQQTPLCHYIYLYEPAGTQRSVSPSAHCALFEDAFSYIFLLSEQRRPSRPVGSDKVPTQNGKGLPAASCFVSPVINIT